VPKAFSEAERQNIRERLLLAARQALPVTGFRRTSVEELCKGVGISKGAFYLFFESKEALCVAVLQQAEQEMRQAVLAELAVEGPDRLHRILTLFFRAAWEDPTLRMLLDAEDLAWLTRSLPPGALEEARADDDRFFGEVWAELVRAGDLGEIDASTFAGVPALALVLAQNHEWLGTSRASALIELVVDGLVLRLGPRPSAGPPSTGPRPSRPGT
jgi:AcrR family transcriptional regulator